MFKPIKKTFLIILSNQSEINPEREGMKDWMLLFQKAITVKCFALGARAGFVEMAMPNFRTQPQISRREIDND